MPNKSNEASALSREIEIIAINAARATRTLAESAPADLKPQLITLAAASELIADKASLTQETVNE